MKTTRIEMYRVIVNGGHEFWIRARHVAAAVQSALKQYKSPLGARADSWIVRVSKIDDPRLLEAIPPRRRRNKGRR